MGKLRKNYLKNLGMMTKKLKEYGIATADMLMIYTYYSNQKQMPLQEEQKLKRN